MFKTTRASAGLIAIALASVLVAAAFALPLSAGNDVPELSVGSVAFNVADFARSEKFYADVLGFKRTGTWPPNGKEDELIEVFLGREGAKSGASIILARLNKDPLPKGASRYGRIIVNTPEAKKIEALAKAAGSESREITLPGDNPPVIIFFNDPDGYEIELYQAPK